jgi:hypothetical protein
MATLNAPADYRGEHFREFCSDIFGVLYRADQRRAGETYLHGLLNCPGRKSVRRMATTTPGGHSEQSLQQFVNQSPWDYAPIRQRLMRRLVKALPPVAWVIEEVAFPKHGRYSAAVERQYVQALEKVCNCQLAITVTLTSERFSVPVNWRLVIPESWGEDAERRGRARMPDHERPRPYWHYQVEVLDDMALDWGMPPAPVLVDTRQLAAPDALFAALEDRGLPYLAQVSGSLCVQYDKPARQPGGSATQGGAAALSWRGSVGELVRRAATMVRTTVGWQDADEDVFRRSQFLQVPVRSPATDGPAARSVVPPPARRLVAEWPLSRPQPRGYWITNITDRPLADLVALAKLRQRVGSRINRFADQFGLRDYEGRTFAGWHHHVTLATAAYIFDVLNRLRDEARYDGDGAAPELAHHDHGVTSIAPALRERERPAAA